MASDRGDFICDLAETYGIYDYRKVPVHLLGTYAAGLGHNTRIGMKRRGVTAPADVILLAQLYELILTIAWSFKKKKESLPKTPLDEFIVGEKAETKKELKGFSSANAFEQERQKILKEIKNGN